MRQSDSKYSYFPNTNYVLIEVKFSGSPVVFTDIKNLDNLKEESVTVVGIGNEVKNTELQIGDLVHIPETATSRVAIPDKYINSDLPTVLNIMDIIKKSMSENKKSMEGLESRYEAYAWFVVREFDVAGILYPKAEEDKE